MATTRENLREALSTIRKKMRSANTADAKAYRKSMNLKGVKRGNTRKRSPRPKATAEAIISSVSEAGRDAGAA